MPKYLKDPAVHVVMIPGIGRLKNGVVYELPHDRHPALGRGLVRHEGIEAPVAELRIPVPKAALVELPVEKSETKTAAAYAPDPEWPKGGELLFPEELEEKPLLQIKEPSAQTEDEDGGPESETTPVTGSEEKSDQPKRRGRPPKKTS